MPKRIENLKETILDCAKAELLKNGYDALTIRGVARAAGIAVGTVYNYFPSKDMLAGSVILADWQTALSLMQARCEAAGSVPEALTALFETVTAFSDVYRAVWGGYTFSASARSEYGDRHNLLVTQLAACLSPVLARFAQNCPPGTAVFLAENVLITSGNSALTFLDFLRIAERILL